MLRPSYAEIMETLNNQQGMDMEITSRYTIVIAAAKRARVLVSGSEALVYSKSDKPVSIAIKELSEGKLTITVSKDATNQIEKAFNYQPYYITQEDLGIE